MTYKEEAERLQAENAELKAHIQRWAKDDILSFAPDLDHEMQDGSCTIDGYVWPCPTEVAKGWEE